MFAFNVMTGGVLSMTVKLTTLLVKLPTPSLAVTVIACGPTPTIVPAAGLWAMVAPPQLSLAELPATTSGITAWQLALAEAVESAGTDSVGGTSSITVITCVAVAE